MRVRVAGLVSGDLRWRRPSRDVDGDRTGRDLEIASAAVPVEAGGRGGTPDPPRPPSASSRHAAWVHVDAQVGQSPRQSDQQQRPRTSTDGGAVARHLTGLRRLEPRPMLRQPPRRAGGTTEHLRSATPPRAARCEGSCASRLRSVRHQPVRRQRRAWGTGAGVELGGGTRHPSTPVQPVGQRATRGARIPTLNLVRREPEAGASR